MRIPHMHLAMTDDDSFASTDCKTALDTSCNGIHDLYT
jgi:hypothetical protein